MRKARAPLTPLRLLRLLLLAVPAACSDAPRADVVGKWDCLEVQPTPYEEMVFTMEIEPKGRFFVDAEADGQFDEGHFQFAFTGSGKLTTPKDQFIAIYKDIDVEWASMDDVAYDEAQVKELEAQQLAAVGYTFTIDTLTADEMTVHDRTSHTVCKRIEG
ncbi:MAG: hypothetical protein R3C08_13755 [Hyphomonas sp.]